MADQPTPSSSSQRGHKRTQAQTNIPQFFQYSKGKKQGEKARRTHTKNTSSGERSHHFKNPSLPNNRTAFYGNYASRSKIPKYTKSNIWTKRYEKLPYNVKYNRYTMNAAKGQGSITAAHSTEHKSEESQHFYETRPVKAVMGTKATPQAYWQRSRDMKIEMKTRDTWPTYTFSITALTYKEQGNYYERNTGYRHHSKINFKKSTTDLIYQIKSNQPWECRIIIWTSGQHKEYFNRASDITSRRQDNEELELTNNIGIMTVDGTTNKAHLRWDEIYADSSDNLMTVPVSHDIDNLLERPRDTKHPSAAFYWGPSEDVGVIYDAIHVIPGKENYLDSTVHIEKTWQKLPGLCEFKDKRERGGGGTTKPSKEIKNNLMTYMTCIWQPCGRHAGEPLPAEGTTLANILELDIIHTLYWDE